MVDPWESTGTYGVGSIAYARIYCWRNRWLRAILEGAVAGGDQAAFGIAWLAARKEDRPATAAVLDSGVRVD
jgi:hypothetical protein